MAADELPLEGADLGAAAAAARIDLGPAAASAVTRCASAMMLSALACTSARFGSSWSKAPAAASVSTARLLIIFGLSRRAKSDRLR